MIVYADDKEYRYLQIKNQNTVKIICIPGKSSGIKYVQGRFLRKVRYRREIRFIFLPSGMNVFKISILPKFFLSSYIFILLRTLWKKPAIFTKLNRIDIADAKSPAATFFRPLKPGMFQNLKFIIVIITSEITQQRGGFLCLLRIVCYPVNH